MTRFIRLAVVSTTLIFSLSQTAWAAKVGCIKGNCFNGYGTYKYSNGNEYVGNFVEGQPHGDGILYCSNGNKYLGSWERSWRQGKGRFVFAEGHEYLGEMHRNHFQGKGVMSYANGDKYNGQWKASKPNGFGNYLFKNGSKYEGDFLDGSFHGKGTMSYIDGSTYIGNWKKSKQHGEGVFKSSDGLEQRGEWLYGELSTGNGAPHEANETIQVNVEMDEEDASSNRSGHVVPTSSVRIWAVVVGVANYTHMPALRYTDDDAYHFFAHLKSPEGGALPDEQVKVLIDDNATRDNILAAMRGTLLKADDNDVVLFYFSGHGVEGAFVPVDFDGYKNQLEHSEIRKILQASKARHKVVLGDACHSGSLYGMSITGEPLASRTAVNDMLERYYDAFENCGGGLALLLSSKGKEVSLEDSGLRSGVFSHFLIQGMKGAADKNLDGIVSIFELYEYTNAKVTGYTAGAQTPVITGAYDKRMPVSVVR